MPIAQALYNVPPSLCASPSGSEPVAEREESDGQASAGSRGPRRRCPPAAPPLIPSGASGPAGEHRISPRGSITSHRHSARAPPDTDLSPKGKKATDRPERGAGGPAAARAPPPCPPAEASGPAGQRRISLRRYICPRCPPARALPDPGYRGSPVQIIWMGPSAQGPGTPVNLGREGTGGNCQMESMIPQGPR